MCHEIQASEFLACLQIIVLLCDSFAAAAKTLDSSWEAQTPVDSSYRFLCFIVFDFFFRYFKYVCVHVYVCPCIGVYIGFKQFKMVFIVLRPRYGVALRSLLRYFSVAFTITQL